MEPTCLEQPLTGAFSPYPNRNAFLLGDWYWNSGVQKSQANFQSLVDVVGNPTFSPADVRDVHWTDVNRRLVLDDEWVDEGHDTGWEHTPVTISVPFQPRRGTPSDCNAVPQQFTVSDFYHRNLVSVIREKLASAADDDFFHYQPFKLKWQSAAHPGIVNVHGELYNSEAFIEADRELRSSPPEPKCNAPRHIVAMMFSSDSTHLTSFGDAKLWPLYLYFGNESKYRRCKPSCHLANHVAYFQNVRLSLIIPLLYINDSTLQLPDSFKEFATSQSGGKTAPSDPFMTFCHRELMHAQWKVLLDDDFIEAWKHGILIECCDGIYRRFYPRIFTHSGDYPEKYASGPGSHISTTKQV